MSNKLSPYIKKDTKVGIFLKKYFSQLLILHYAYLTSRFIKNYMKNPSIFQAIEIETINRCNGTCDFCPVNKNVDSRPFKIMEEDLFKKIINDLSTINYTGYVALYSNNEPFMDKRMVEFIKYAREKLGGAFILLYTNASMLTVDKLQTIIPIIDRIDIDNYNDDLILNPHVSKLYDYCVRNNVDIKKVRIHLRKEHEVLTSRGGQAPNKGAVKTIKSKCYLPYTQMVIRPDGKASLCCNDALGKYTLGDATHNSVSEIWNSQYYNKVRNVMCHTGRKNLILCKDCDTCHRLTF